MDTRDRLTTHVTYPSWSNFVPTSAHSTIHTCARYWLLWHTVSWYSKSLIKGFTLVRDQLGPHFVRRLMQCRSWPLVYSPRRIMCVIIVFKAQELVTLVLGSGKGGLYAVKLHHPDLGSPFRHSRVVRPRLQHRSSTRRDCTLRHSLVYQWALEHARVGYP